MKQNSQPKSINHSKQNIYQQSATVKTNSCQYHHHHRLNIAFDGNFVFEEILNSVSHAVGLALSIIGSIFLIYRASLSSTHMLAAIIFSASLVMLYFFSTLYHAFFKLGLLKIIFQRLDHLAIYFLIAGTYTPIALISLHGPLGYTLMIASWTLGFIGIFIDIFYFDKYPLISTLTYLAMGWISIIAIKPLISLNPLGNDGLFWLVAGGLVYTAGVYFFLKGSKNPINHAIWHCFVLCGSFCHYILIYECVITKPLTYFDWWFW
eukprot:TRINITY_DN6645_c0_g1_i1.p1 TRINITY_DN6645_c0_g1~~TRINITY_DN6645_c0_g1_i1.p1  ORF type:complete len:290 (+),score=52.00 TRINITY_DN6645_c0_g1_i1:80-871(+)